MILSPLLTFWATSINCALIFFLVGSLRGVGFSVGVFVEEGGSVVVALCEGSGANPKISSSSEDGEAFEVVVPDCVPFAVVALGGFVDEGGGGDGSSKEIRESVGVELLLLLDPPELTGLIRMPRSLSASRLPLSSLDAWTHPGGRAGALAGLGGSGGGWSRGGGAAVR